MRSYTLSFGVPAAVFLYTHLPKHPPARPSTVMAICGTTYSSSYTKC